MTRFQAPALLTALLLVAAGVFAATPPAATADEEMEPRTASTALDAFVMLPDSLLRLLPTEVRLDMNDYWEAGDTARQLANALGGRSWIESATPLLAKVRVTPVSSVAVGLYGGKAPTVVAAYSVEPQYGAADSELFFFDASMNPLRASRLFRAPAIADFIVIPVGEKRKVGDVERLIPFPTVLYTLDPAAGTLTATLTATQTLTREQAAELEPYLRKSIIYRWDGSRFRPDKPEK